MEYCGKYTFSLETDSGALPLTVAVRESLRGYEGEVIFPNSSSDILENVHTEDGRILFEIPVGGRTRRLALDPAGSGLDRDSGKALEVTFRAHRRRALILYATMTKNTELVANWFAETFRYYNWEVNCLRLKAGLDWEALQEQLYFDDYDVICLGSPIVAGYPLTIINKLFSLGAGGALEANVQKQIDAGGGFKAEKGTMGGGPDGVTGPEGQQPPVMGKKQAGVRWRRRVCPFPGGQLRDNYHPLGIVFTTFGGGFFGPNESLATLEALKNFLSLNDVTVIGTFACCGREFGPAGLKEGEKPRMMVPGEMPDPLYYELADGSKVQGSYFFHYNNWTKPCSRDEAKAKSLIADIVEDYFMTYDGKRRPVFSEYISIS